VEIREVQDDASLAALAPAWRELHERSRSRNVYLGPEFISPWWSALGRVRGGAAERPGGLGRDSAAEGLRILTAYEDGRLVGLAPLQLQTVTVDGLPAPIRVLSFLGDVFITRYRDFLTEPGKGPEFCAAAWSHLCGDGGAGWDAVFLSGLQEESPTGQQSVEVLNRLAPAGLRHVRFKSMTEGGLTAENVKDARQDLRLAAAASNADPALRAELERQAAESPDAELLPALDRLSEAHPDLAPLVAGARARLKSRMQDLEYPYIALPPTWDDYKASLSRKTRAALRNDANQLARAGEVSYETIESGFDAGADFEDLVRLHRLMLGDGSLTLNEQTLAMQKAAIAACAGRGWLRLIFLRLAGARVGVIACFDHEGRRYAALLGRDPAVRGSLGILAITRAIEDAIARGLTDLDFGPGHVRYKERFTKTVRKVTNLLAKRDSVPMGLRDLAPRLSMFG
jgi:CelD/BcsL family acetyltransferase involved in cellulose biosynthesis